MLLGFIVSKLHCYKTKGTRRKGAFTLEEGGVDQALSRISSMSSFMGGAPSRST